MPNYTCNGCGISREEDPDWKVVFPLHPTIPGVFCPFCLKFGKTPEDLEAIRKFAGKHGSRGVREGMMDID